MGVFAGIGTVLSAIFTAVGVAIVATISLIAAIITSIVGALYLTFAAIATTIGASVTALVTGNFAAAAASISAAWGTLGAFVSLTYTSIASYMTVVAEAWGAFAAAIHLHTLIQINNVLTIVSPQYRLMVQGIWGNISKVSAALGWGVGTLSLMLRNARAIVLDTSAMLGKPYDIADVNWTQNMMVFLQRYGANINSYRDRPEILLDFIDNALVKDAVNTKAYAMQGVFTTIEGLVTGVTKFAGDLETVAKDVNKFTADLPAEIQFSVEHFTRPITDNIITYVDDTKSRIQSDVKAILGVVNTQNTELKNSMQSIHTRLNKPGDLLEAVDDLDYKERILQESLIGDVSTREAHTIIQQIPAHTEEFTSEMDRITKLGEITVPLPSWEVPEKLEPNPLPQSQEGKENTWFVGDY
jgi:archaellum component FlaC